MINFNVAVYVLDGKKPATMNGLANHDTPPMSGHYFYTAVTAGGPANLSQMYFINVFLLGHIHIVIQLCNILLCFSLTRILQSLNVQGRQISAAEFHVDVICTSLSKIIPIARYYCAIVP